MKILQLQLDSGSKPLDYDLLNQYGLVKPRTDKDHEEEDALNLYPRPSYKSGVLPQGTALIGY
jgi:hypothetical protein